MLSDVHFLENMRFDVIILKPEMKWTSENIKETGSFNWGQDQDTKDLVQASLPPQRMFLLSSLLTVDAHQYGGMSFFFMLLHGFFHLVSDFQAILLHPISITDNDMVTPWFGAFNLAL